MKLARNIKRNFLDRNNKNFLEFLNFFLGLKKKKKNIHYNYP